MAHKKRALVQPKTQSFPSKRKVKPIENFYQIGRIRDFLRNKPRDLLLFEIAIHSGLTMKQILTLKIKDLMGCNPGDQLLVNQAYGDKYPNAILMNKTICNAWQQYLREINPNKDDYVIFSRKGKGSLTLPRASHLVNSWYKAVGLKGLSGASSLRRTWQVHFKDVSSQNSVASSSDPIQTLAPVKHHVTIQERVYSSIFTKIISGQIPPGERLIINKVARRLNVSAIPVREAFQRLQTAGMIILGEKQNLFVNRLSLKDFDEITRIRLFIEIEVVKEAARRCDERTKQIIKTLHTDYIEACNNLEQQRNIENINAHQKVNREFHYTIYRQANMPIFLQTIELLWNRFSPYLHILNERVDEYKPRETIQRHEGMLQGMIQKKPKVAAEWIHEDITKSGKILAKFLSEF